MYSLISSKNNEKIKTVRKLSDKKYRLQLGLFVLEGHKLVYDYVRSGSRPVQLFVTEEALEKYGSIIDSAECEEVCVLPRELYMHISNESAPQGILAVCRVPGKTGDYRKGKTVILESVRDAGNLGTVIRTAVAFGIDNIVMSSDCADIYNPKTLRAAMGGLFFANLIVVDDLCTFVDGVCNDGRRVFAAMPAGDAVDVRDIDIRSDDCMVIGNEGNGISASLAARCTRNVTIPMRGDAESLNASAAASILMWELVRGGNN